MGAYLPVPQGFDEPEGLSGLRLKPPSVWFSRRRDIRDADLVTILKVFFRSWARYFLDLRMVFFSTGCVKRRSTETVTVCRLRRWYGAVQDTFWHLSGSSSAARKRLFVQIVLTRAASRRPACAP